MLQGSSAAGAPEHSAGPPLVLASPRRCAVPFVAQTITADPRVVVTQSVQLVLDIVRSALAFIQYLPYTGERHGSTAAGLDWACRHGTAA